MTSATGGVLAASRGSTALGGRAERALWIVIATGVGAALMASAMGVPPAVVLALFVLPLTLIAARGALLAWGTLLALILVVILFIPIRRYTVGGELPFELEPYRVVIALVLGCWLLALAADPEVRWRKTGLEPAIAMFGAAILLSLALNVGRVEAVSDVVVKQVSFFASFFLVLYFVASVIQTRSQLDRVLALVVSGGAVLGVAALYEWRTGTNLFNGLGSVIPFLQYQDIGDAMVRGTGARALASAQHPIALGALLVMLLPLALYLYMRDRRRIWIVCSVLLTLGALSSGSRTAALMLMVVTASILWIKRGDALRLVPVVLALICVIQVAMPGTLGSFRGMLRPSHVIAEQSVGGGTGSGRIADLGPGLAEFSAAPFFGQGFGTRVVAQEEDDAEGAPILDNQWLGTLLDVGAIGAIGLAWLFLRAIRRLARSVRSSEGLESWLAASLASALTAFTIGLFTYDAFAFIQVTFFAFILLGFAAVATREAVEVGADQRDPALRPSPARI